MSMPFRCVSFLLWICLLFAPLDRLAAAPPGENLYLHGVLQDGSSLTAQVTGGALLRGPYAACANCHRRSGFGLSEGEALAPRITGDALFRPYAPRRADLSRTLYQEPLTPRTLAAVRTPKQRPAYTRAALAHVLRDGVDPAGRQLDVGMPRYQLDKDDLDNLIDYLRQLGTASAPGVEDDFIRFATIIAGEVEPDQVAAMKAVIDAFVQRHNFEVETFNKHYGRFPYGKDLYRRSRRKWQVHYWHLSGVPDDWAAQLLRHTQDVPVFALLSGIGKHVWQPIHDFCQTAKVPCIFPNIRLPIDLSRNDYALYFSKGLILEAEVLAHWLTHSSPMSRIRNIVQIFQDTPEGAAMAAAFKRYAWQHEDIRIRTIKMDRHEPLQRILRDRLTRAKCPDAIVLWMVSSRLPRAMPDASSCLATTPLYVAGGLLGAPLAELGHQLSENLFATYRFALPQSQIPRVHRLRSWLRSRRILHADERLLLNTYFALSVTNYALIHMVDHFSQDYLIESIEHETENALNPGTYVRLSLGPGQRFASKGAYVVHVPQHQAEIQPVSSWIVP